MLYKTVWILCGIALMVGQLVADDVQNQVVAVRTKPVSMADARASTGVAFPDQYFVFVSGLEPARKLVRIAVRYRDANGPGLFVAAADIGKDGGAVLGVPVADIGALSVSDVYVDYGNTTSGYDFPQ